MNGGISLIPLNFGTDNTRRNVSIHNPNTTGSSFCIISKATPPNSQIVKKVINDRATLIYMGMVCLSTFIQ